MSERRKYTMYIGEELRLSYGIFDDDETIQKIDTIMGWINRQKDNAATHVEFGAEIDYDGEVEAVYLQPIKYEIESEAAYQKRLEKKRIAELKALNEKIEFEKAEYKRLKKKYGS